MKDKTIKAWLWLKEKLKIVFAPQMVQHEKTAAVKLLGFCILFLSLEAMLGGFFLMISPEGNALRLPVYLLKNSPFANYSVPGFVLFVFLGLYPFAVFWGLWHKPTVFKINTFDLAHFMEHASIDKTKHWAWSGAVYSAMILIIWIAFQVMYMGYFSALQTFYSLLGVAIIFLALMPSVVKYYTQQEPHAHAAGTSLVAIEKKEM